MRRICQVNGDKSNNIGRTVPVGGKSKKPEHESVRVLVGEGGKADGIRNNKLKAHGIGSPAKKLTQKYSRTHTL